MAAKCKTEKCDNKAAESDNTTEQAPETRKRHKIDPAKVKAGDLMVFPYTGTVNRVGYGGQTLGIDGMDGTGGFSVTGAQLIENAYSADQFHEEVKVTKTKAAEILISAYNRPFTVCFDKQDGTERKLRGRLVEPEPLLGRSHVEDLDIKTGHKLRLVDHRTIKWLILEGVKYVVK